MTSTRFNSKRSTALVLPLLVAVLAAAMWCLMVPVLAQADEQGIVAHSVDDSGTRIDYYSVDDAINAGYEGKTIVMDANWNSYSALVISYGKSITIDMNAHEIYNYGHSEVIRLYDDASLTLMSSASAKFTYQGYVDGKCSRTGVEVTTGGLVSGGYSKSDDSRYEDIAGGIMMDGHSSLTLDNVVVGGNLGDRAGGILAMGDCCIRIQNGASVEHNVAVQNYGGGITAWGNCVNILMDKGFVKSNYGYNGGGISVLDDGATISMKNKSAISGNHATNNGGGAFFDNTFFQIMSEDRTASIDGNSCDNEGGGVYTASVSDDNDGLIVDTAIADNTAGVDGGGVYLDQENTEMLHCTITGNTAKEDGGGVYVCNDDNKIADCTITGNVCNDGGDNYEGGGVFVGYRYDLNLTGKCVIKDNTRGKNGSADDLFLSANVGNTASAYITGGVDLGSKVGIRTGITGDQRIGDHIGIYAEGVYFADLGGYYVSHGDDHGGDLWQRHHD